VEVRRGATKFRDLYERATASMCRELEQAGRPPAEILDVPTSFGSTRCLHWAGEGEPIVLLHGQAGSWLAWGPLLKELGPRDVYALDVVGEPGGSTQTVPIETGADLAAWLDATVTSLGISAMALAGMSYGGWIAVHHAAAHPGKVSALVLLDPAIGTVTMRRVLRQGLLVAAARALPPPLRRSLARRIDAEPLVFDDRLRKGPALAFRKFDRRIPTYAQLDDPTPEDLLRDILAPTLVVLGGRSELHDVTAVADKARRNIEDLELHIVAGASHALPVTKPRAVAEVMVPFLARRDRTVRSAEPPAPDGT
jgi:pimeloyl-ACP methyl ester carboxylesterase